MTSENKHLKRELNLADAVWLASYAAIALALLRMPSGRRRLDRDGAVDIAVVTIVTLLVLWELAIEEILALPVPAGEPAGARR